LIILAIDAATRCGFAMGRIGSTPASWSDRLRSPDDPPSRAARKMGIVLRDLFSTNRLDVVYIEQPVRGGMNMQTNANTILVLQGLYMAVHAICGPYGVRAIEAHVQTVRKHFVGVARPDNPKRAVLERCYALGWLERDCEDDNRADALALWSFACHQQVERGYTAPATRLVNVDAAE
jgi:Holliday junction resolvasome RuvABC endonuclease subunit